MKCEVIPFPAITSERDRERYSRVAPRIDKFNRTMNYLNDLTFLLFDVAHPYYGGWVETEAACLQRRTKAEFLKMFLLYDCDLACDFLGFRDIAEGILCDEAAREAGSSWRFFSFYREHKEAGGDGLGTLNAAIEEYSRCYTPELFPGSFP